MVYTSAMLSGPWLQFMEEDALSGTIKRLNKASTFKDSHTMTSIDKPLRLINFTPKALS